MPYELAHGDGRCSAGQPWAVVKSADLSLMGCHPSQAAAAAQMAALYASEDRTMEQRAEWDTGYMNDLPDSAFACVDAGGEKDETGRTTPRSLRHYPHHNAAGALDLPHLRAALSRVAQEETTSCGVRHLREHATAEGIGGRAVPPLYERAIPALTEFEFRAAPEGGEMPRFYGYAAVFGHDSEPLPFVETIAPGAFARSLANESRRHTFVMDHDETRLLASRQAKTLTLSEDSTGLYIEADLPPTSYARDLVALHERGEARAMSFTFRATRTGETWSADGKRRSLSEVRLGHVAVLTGLAPAYRQTSASIRSLAGRLGAEAEELEDTLDLIRDGRPLDARAVALLESVVGELREQPAEAEPTAPSGGLSISLAQARLALMARAR